MEITKKIIYNTAKLGLESAGALVCGPVWPVVKKIFSPVINTLASKFPDLLLKDKKKAAEAAEKAVEALSRDKALQMMIQDGFLKLEDNQEMILRILARNEDTLIDIQGIVIQGFDRADQKMDIAFRLIYEELTKLRTEFTSTRGLVGVVDTPPIARLDLTIKEIYLQANSKQIEAMNRISTRDLDTAAHRLAEARALLDIGLNREPNHSQLLTIKGYVEKTQAQISSFKGDQDASVKILREAANYFVKAWKIDSNNYGAINGMANIFYYAKDYEMAIKLGTMLFEITPDYGPAVFDFSLALEGKLKETGLDTTQRKLLIDIYEHLEKLMPRQPQIFSVKHLTYVQSRLSAQRGGT